MTFDICEETVFMARPSFPQPYQTADEQADWQQAAWQYYLMLTAAHPLTPAAEEQLRICHHYLRSWGQPAETRYAALFLPWRVALAEQWSTIAPHPPELNQRINAWYHLYQLTAPGPIAVADPARAAMLRLRRLMRYAYLDLPVVILTVADHAARLMQIHSQPLDDHARALWQETERVFLPLLAMLGLWHLRRIWVEQAAAALHAPELSVIQAAVEAQHATVEPHLIPNIARVLRAHLPADRPFTIRSRTRAYGRVYQRQQRGEAMEAVAATTTLEIEAADEATCYQILGALHTLGKPVLGRLRDQIAAPGPNGYRVLHTTLVVALPDEPLLQNRMLTVRIMSTAMRRLNHWGILYDQLPAADIPDTVRNQLWWRQTNHIRRELALMQQYDIDEPPAENESAIYVFTPQGELLALPKRSTAIDFAYQLHTEIGHHCYAVWVNGERATHATALNNGHLVRLAHNPFFAGPQSHWLSIARNPSTRRKIKRGLTAQWNTGHAGRAQVERFLQSLRDDTGFVIPGPRLEKHLRDLATDLGLPSLEALYNVIKLPGNVSTGMLAPERVVGFLLEAELTRSVVDGTGQPIVSPHAPRARYGRPNMRFCANCKPVPDAPLVLHRKQTARGEHLTLHRRPLSADKTTQLPAIFGIPRMTAARSCTSEIKAEALDYDVQWAPVDVGYEVFNIAIFAADRSGLVGDLLQPVYDDDYIALNDMSATTDGEGMAQIAFTVACYRMEQFAPFIQKLEHVRGVVKVEHYPQLVSDAGARAELVGASANPYTLLPVGEPQMLFGRQTEVAQLRGWLVADKPCRLIVVYGQRRAGKTSLVQLAPALIGGRNRHVYIDLLSLRHNLTVATICREIIAALHRSLEPHLRPELLRSDYRRPDDIAIAADPAYTLRTYLAQVLDLDPLNHFVLCLDEFNIAVAEYHADDLYSLLRSLLNQFSRLTLILVTHTEYYLHQEKHAAGELFNRAENVEIHLLDAKATRRLIEDPTRTWLKYSPNVISRIMTRTAGHPYLVNLICSSIFKRMQRADRNYVVEHDLYEVERDMLRDGSTAFQFIVNQVISQKVLVTALARQQISSGARVPLAQISSHTGLTLPELHRHAQHLANYQIIDLQKAEGDGGASAAITIPYFAQWVDQNW